MTKAKCIPCAANASLGKKIDRVAEALRTQSHKLVEMDEDEFYDLGIFRGAIEKIRGTFSADTSQKRYFARAILSRLEDRSLIESFEEADSAERFDFVVTLRDKQKAVISCKGCLDGNNTTLYARPDYADEFLIWSMCSNAGADPKHNVWSGIHTRLAPILLSGTRPVDGLIVWDWLCGSSSRPCPKFSNNEPKFTIRNYTLPPPCIYSFPIIAEAPIGPSYFGSNPAGDASLMRALMLEFSVSDQDICHVDFECGGATGNLWRKTHLRGAPGKSSSKGVKLKFRK